MTTSNEPMCYVATKPECGCIIASVLVGSIPLKALGKQVAAWIEEGYNSEYVAHSYVTLNWGICDHRVKQLPLKEQPPAPPTTDDLGITYVVSGDGTVDTLALERAVSRFNKGKAETDGVLQSLREGYNFTLPGHLKSERYLAWAELPDDAPGYTYHIDLVVQSNGAKEPTITPLLNFPLDAAGIIAAMKEKAPLEQWQAEGEAPAPEQFPDYDPIEETVPDPVTTDHDDMVMAEHEATEQA